jgi:hypothetical protein
MDFTKVALPPPSQETTKEVINDPTKVVEKILGDKVEQYKEQPTSITEQPASNTTEQPDTTGGQAPPVPTTVTKAAKNIGIAVPNRNTKGEIQGFTIVSKDNKFPVRRNTIPGLKPFSIVHFDIDDTKFTKKHTPLMINIEVMKVATIANKIELTTTPTVTVTTLNDFVATLLSDDSFDPFTTASTDLTSNLNVLMTNGLTVVVSPITNG